MTTNKQVTLLTVYERANYTRKLLPGFNVTGGTVNLYNHIKPNSSSSAPADKNSMQLDQGSPFGTGYHLIEGDSDYILWETAGGTPVVTTKNLVNNG